MAVGDIYQLKFMQRMSNQDVLNVYYFRETVTGGGSGSDALAQAFIDDILPFYALVQSTAVQYREVAVINGMDNTDWENRLNPPPISGSLPGNAAPAFVVAKLRFNRAGPGSRYSYKAISGMPDDEFDVFELLTALQLGRLQDLVDVLVIPQSGGGFSWQMVQITGGFILGTPPVESHPLTEGQVLPAVSTQLTRKAGRGS